VIAGLATGALAGSMPGSLPGPALVAAVLVAGALGSVLRYGVSRWIPGRFPWAVLVVNVVGSAIAGAVVAGTSGGIRLILVTGFCGGLTTFSTFSVESVQLVLAGRARAALLSVGANLVLGGGAAAAGYYLVG
jgi:CrcB protein